MHGFAVHVGYPHHQGLSNKPGLLSSKRHQWVSSGLQTAGSPTSTRLGSFHRLKRYKKKTADLSRDTPCCARESPHVLRPIFSVRVHDDDSLDFLDPAGDHEPYGDSALVSDIAE